MSGSSPAKGLGLWMCTALVVGSMIGSGVFLLPASLAPYGWNAIFGWGLTIAGGVCLAFVFARLSKALPGGGGPYAYTREAFGPAAGFVVAWSYWNSLWIGNAAIATAAVSYLSVFVPALGKVPGLSAVTTCAVVWLFTGINLRGARLAGEVQLVTTALKLLPLVAVVVLAALVIAGDHGASLAPFHASDISLSGVTASATLTLWALLGLECATAPVGKVVDPERTVPRATMIGTVATGLIYVVVCSAVVLLLPARETAASSAPLADFMARYWGEGARMWLALFAAISALGALNGWILVQGEMPFAMARDGVFPAWLARTTAGGTPLTAHLVSSGLLTVMVLLNYAKSAAQLFTFVILLATTASLIMYLFSALAAVKLMLEGRLEPSRAVIPVAVAAALYSLWAIIGAGLVAAAWGLALLLAGVPVYLLMLRAKARTL